MSNNSHKLENFMDKLSFVEKNPDSITDGDFKMLISEISKELSQSSRIRLERLSFFEAMDDVDLYDDIPF